MIKNIKKNKYRIILWGLIMIIFSFSAYVGINKYEEGYGKKGQARLKLIPIAKEFNRQDAIIRYGDLTADTKGSKIVVTYSPKKGDKKKFTYEYSKEGTHEIISNSYEIEDGYLPELIATGMMDAIYKL